MKKKELFKQFKGVLLILAWVSTLSISAQNVTVNGIVKDVAGEPLIGVTVQVLGTTSGTVTDLDGMFILQNIPANARLEISYVGMQGQVINLQGQTSLDIILLEDTEALEEVVVVGYGVVKKRDLTGSVAQISSKSMKDLKIPNATQAMAGQLPGVQVQQTAGKPGEGATIRIRGVGSISASSSPLYVVDGFPLAEQNLNSVNPSDIESIEVLKDASAAAIYGSRAANGVVLVTTKSGRTGKATVSLDSYFGVQSVSKRMDLLDAQEFIMISKEAFNTNYLDNYPGASINDPVTSRPSGSRYRYPAFYDDPQAVAALGKGTNWQDEIFRTAPMQNYQLTVNGGTENTSYMFTGGYFNQTGIILGSDYERFSARAKIDSKPNNWLKLGINIAPTYSNENQVPEGHWASDGVVNAALATAPVTLVYNPDGTWASQSMYAVSGDGLTGVPNGVAIASDVEMKYSTLRLFTNGYAEISFLDNLVFRTTLGADILNSRYNYFRPSNVPNNGNVAPLPATARVATDRSTNIFNWLNENTLTYNESFGEKHQLDALLGFTVQKNVYRMNEATGSNFPTNIIRTINDATVKSGTSDFTEWSLISYLGRVNYRYDNRYYLTASIRSDGSSRFGKNRRYGSFPSASVAWRVSQEEFMRDVSWLDDLKLRASIGLTGNNSITNYGAIGLMSNANYVFGSGTGDISPGSVQSSISNSDLTWEKTKQYDVGVDLVAFNNRVTFTVDAYLRKTTDLLLDVKIPSVSGFTNAWQNIGKMDNRGLEFSVNSINYNRGDFTWTTNANLSFLQNKVVELGPSGDPIYSAGGVGSTNITMIGHPIGSFYGYKQIGVYMNQSDLDNSPKLSNSHVGDVKYDDIDNNNVIDADDRTIIGNNIPDFIWGLTNQFTYRNFDMSFLIQGVQGNEILHLGKRFYTQLEGNQGQMKIVLNRWQSEQNPGDGWTPRANSQTTGQNNAISSRWVEDGSFVRLNNVTLGYTLPQGMSKQLYFQNLRIYLSAQNLLTLTKYSGFNPETSFNQDSVLAPGTDYGMYPLARVVTVGFNLTF